MIREVDRGPHVASLRLGIRRVLRGLERRLDVSMKRGAIALGEPPSPFGICHGDEPPRLPVSAAWCERSRLAHFADELPRHGIGFQPTDRAGRTDTLEQRHVFAESGDIHDPGFALSHVSLRRALAWIADRASAVTRDPKV